MTLTDFFNDGGWTPFENQVRLAKFPYPTARDASYQRDKPTTNLGSELVVMPSAVQQDTYLDNELGETLRKTKAKFGRAPFIEAYKRALNTSKEINDRRKKCLEEEVKLRSVLGAGED